MKKVIKVLLITLITYTSLTSVNALNKINISYDEKGLIQSVDELEELDKAVAGDKIGYTFNLKNNTEKDKKLYLLLKTESDNYLSQNIDVIVTYNDKEVFNDKLNVTQDENTLELGTYKPNEKGVLKVELKIDEKADNNATMSLSDLTLTFTSSDIETVETADSIKYSCIPILVAGVGILMLRKRRKRNEQIM